MDIGVVLQTTPPSARVVDLATKAETYGFSHVWTFDSHILWEEPFPIYTRILAETRNVIVGPMVTNPLTRDWTVTASVFATLNEMFGNRTVIGIGRGDSAVRVINGKPSTLAGLGDAVGVIRELVNGREVEYRGSTMRFPWASKQPSRGVDGGIRAQGVEADGEVGDGFILQLADPDIAAWTIGSVRRAAEEAGRDPDSITICVAAPAYVGDDVAHAREQMPVVRRDGRQPRRRHRRPLRRGSDVPSALTEYIAGRRGIRLQRARPGGKLAHGLRARRHRRPVLHPGAGRGARAAPAGAARARRRPVRRLSPARRQGRDASGLRREDASRRSPSTCGRSPDSRDQTPSSALIRPSRTAATNDSWSRSFWSAYFAAKSAIARSNRSLFPR